MSKNVSEMRELKAHFIQREESKKKRRKGRRGEEKEGRMQGRKKDLGAMFWKLKRKWTHSNYFLSAQSLRTSSVVRLWFQTQNCLIFTSTLKVSVATFVSVTVLLGTSIVRVFPGTKDAELNLILFSY